MWILLAGVLMCYMIGFLMYCCYNTKNGTSSDAEIPSGGSPPSDNSRISGNRRNQQNHHNHENGGGSRLGGLRFLPLSCLYDEITQRNSDLPQSALTAQREQQLRQIKLEINELSRRLGIGQIYRDRQYVHLPLTTRHTFIQPGYRRTRPGSCGGGSGGNGGSSSGPEVLGVGIGHTNYDGSPGSSSLEMSFFSSPPSSSSETFGQTSGSQSVERNTIFQERERRLRLIRMEIEDLTLQLSSLSEDRSTSENNAGGCSISSSDLEGLVFEPDSSEDEEDGPNSCSIMSMSMNLDELPSYDESVIIDMDESPPPSYAQCAHLYSCEEDHSSTHP